MTTLNTPDADDMTAEVRHAFSKLTGLECVPPLYRQIGNSTGALAAYLGIEQALKDGVLTRLDVETIKLVVSGHNSCTFCIQTHSAKAEAVGISHTDIDAAIKGDAMTDARQEAIRAACTQLLGGRKLSDELRAALDDSGMDEAGLVEMALAMASISFANWFNHINHTTD